jgi:cytochrome P450
MSPPPTSTPSTTARTPQGPRGHLLLGALPEIRKNALAFLSRVAREYGDVSRYRLGPLTSHLIAHPGGVRQVLQENVKNYTKDHVAYSLLRRIVGNGLITSQGAFWLRQRRLAQPAFHKQRIAAMGRLMTEAAREALEQWEPHASSGEPLVVGREMMKLTLRVVGEALFGANMKEQAAVVGRSVDVLVEQVTTRFRTYRLLPPVLPTRYDREFREATRSLDTIVSKIIAERRRRGEDTGDLLSMFMLARDEETGEQMDDRQLRDEIMTMLIAGHETTATTLSWVWVLLAQNPQAEERLHAELDEVLGERLPTVEDLPRLEWTRKVVDETLRLYPPAYVISRGVAQDDVIGGYRIPGGTTVDISPWVTHRHPALWEAPDEFRPERFSPEESAKRPRFAYFPFIAGPRQCIGNGFALMEAQLLLASMARRFRLRLAPGYQPEPEPLITLRPKGGLPMVLERRSPVAR